MANINIVLFDIGGVLVELTGVTTMLEWTKYKYSESELWNLWLNSPAVRNFETGRSSPDQFADEIIKEMKLPVDKLEFIYAFTQWTGGLFQGATSLLETLKKYKTLACFSNSNELHWPKLMIDMGLEKMFGFHFASHLIGKLKPDPDSFEHVIGSLDCPASSILFFDDNELNVESAKKVGIKAYNVKGPKEAEQMILKLGLINTRN